MERILRRLREGPDRHTHETHRDGMSGGWIGEDLRHQERAGGIADEHEAGEQGEPAGRGDQQRLERRGSGGAAVVLDADQQVGGDRRQLPRGEHRDQVVGDDDAEHRPGEQREQTGEAIDAVTAGRTLRWRYVVGWGEVVPRVGDDREADPRDDQHHHGAEGVESQGHLDPQLGHPRNGVGDRLAVEQAVEVRGEPQQCRQRSERGQDERPSPERPSGDGQGDAEDGVQKEQGDQHGAPLVVDRPRGVIQSAG